MKIILVSILTLFCTSVFAKWELLDKNEKYELYIDSTSVKKTNDGYRFVYLYSYYEQLLLGSRRSGYYKYQSFGYEEEINCKTKMARLFSSFPFTYPVGQGLVKVNKFEGEWISVSDTKKKRDGIRLIFKKLCG